MCNTTTTVSIFRDPADGPIFAYRFFVFARDRGTLVFRETYEAEMTEFGASYHADLQAALTGRKVLYEKKPILLPPLEKKP